MRPAIQQLDFDVYQRFKGICEVIKQIRVSESGLILDVGGYPGTFAEMIPSYRVITLDTEHCPRKDYVMGSGEALPFGENTFDAVVCSDTLEHIPPERRKDFLTELVWVSKDWIIIGSPFDFRYVRSAEQMLNELHRFIKRTDNPWLNEHIQYGLPNLQETIEQFRTESLSCALVPNSDLVLWFTIMEFRTLLELIPEGVSILPSISTALNINWEDAIFPKNPPYRYIVVGNKQGKDISLSMATSGVSEDSSIIQITENKIQAIGNLVKETAEKIITLYDGIERKEVPLSATLYITQLEKVVKFQEAELKRVRAQNEQLAQRLEQYEKNGLIRLMRALGRTIKK
ncbi:class I SAM-dependent methyltransferase [Candidatus Sumerlaeota bacterium]|nr:class I SAM-dependent methyltransferase [Candidatus Sumerlaeota bacterium]